MSSKFGNSFSTYNHIYRITRRAGFKSTKAINSRLISERVVAARVVWAKQHLKQDWGNVWFSDECSVWLNRGNVRFFTNGTS